MSVVNCYAFDLSTNVGGPTCTSTEPYSPLASLVDLSYPFPVHCQYDSQDDLVDVYYYLFDWGISFFISVRMWRQLIQWFPVRAPWKSRGLHIPSGL